MNRYTELTTAEKIDLTDEEFYTAVKLEAIQRGVSPPISLPEALQKFGYRGYEIPPEAATFYEITAPSEYSRVNETGIAFRTADEARRACVGAIVIERPGYGVNPVPKLSKADFSIREVLITLVPAQSFITKLEAYTEDSKDFNVVCDECRNDWSAVLQANYDARVNEQKKAQYLTLAQGNEDIAKAFWSKAERTEWPAV